MPDAINLAALPSTTRYKVRQARKLTPFVYVCIGRNGFYRVSTTGGDGWALVLG